MSSVDLIYLDPQFTSNATYNILFKVPTGEQSQAQIQAFEDTWHWSETAEDAYWQVLNGEIPTWRGCWKPCEDSSARTI